MARIDHRTLVRDAVAMLAAAGMEEDKANVTAEVLVEADMIGHTTHGVGLLPWYLDSLKSGELIGSGNYSVINDREACITWDGNNLAGPWLVTKALELACDRAPSASALTPWRSRGPITSAPWPPISAR